MLLILLILIFIRPFISSFAFPYLNSLYSAFFLIFLASWVIIKKPALTKISFLKYPIILFCLALTISIVFSLDKLNSLRELYKYISGLLLFLIAASFTCEDKIRLIRAIVLAGFIISILAIYQYFFGFQHILDYISKQKLLDASFTLDYISRKRVFSPFVTPNALAGYLTMIIALALTQKYRAWFIILLSFALLLTKSIGALSSLFLASGLYFYLQGKFKTKTIFFLSELLVVMALVFIARSTTVKQHLQPIFSTMMRLSYWKDTLRIIATDPLTGVGLGNFNLSLSRYAHNSYLQIWAEMGILGIISILWLITTVFKSGLKNIDDLPDKNQILALLSANTIFLIHNFVDFTFFLPEVALIWWVILGLILS